MFGHLSKLAFACCAAGPTGGTGSRCGCPCGSATFLPLQPPKHAAPAQATRGGRVKLATLAAPPSDYNHEAKGDALHAMEVTLALEKVWPPRVACWA